MRRNRKEYRRKKEHHALHTNFRLQKTGEKPTIEEATEVFEKILATHRVPRGWKMAVIEWTHARSGTRGWIEGTMRDLSKFDDVMEYLLENMRVGIDRAKSRGGVWEIEIAMEY